MKITDEAREKAYKQLTDERVRELYWRPESGQQLWDVFEQSELPENKYDTYATVIGDVILGFYKKDRLPQLLQSELQIAERKAKKIADELASFLAPVSDTTQSNDVATPLRTMAEDMQKTHGYGATAQTEETTNDEPVYHSPQETVLQRPSVANTPTYRSEQEAETTSNPEAEAVDTEAAARDEANVQRWQSNFENKANDSGQTESS